MNPAYINLLLYSEYAFSIITTMGLGTRKCLFLASCCIVIATTCTSQEHRQSWSSQRRNNTIFDQHGSGFISYNNCSYTKINMCPAWQYCRNGQCSCGNAPQDIIRCSKNSDLLLLNCFGATFNGKTNQTEVGQCLLNCEHFIHGHDDQIYTAYPSNVSELNDAFCSDFNRKGSLCGSCKDGYYPLAYSYNMTCVKCEDTWYNWIEYIVIVYLPLTIFYFIILFLQINTTSSYLLGFVLYSQVISFPMMCRIIELSYRNGQQFKIPTEIGVSLYGFWNLDFFRIMNHKTCLRSSILLVSVLDLLSGIYPLFLILLTCVGVCLYDSNYKSVRILVKPFSALFRKYRGNFEIKTSLIDAFSTFFLLSNTKLFNVSFDLLIPTKIYTLSSTGEVTTTYRLYLDGDIKYFRGAHIPYGMLAIAVIFVSVILPTLCLILYPLHITQKCITVLPQQWRIVLHIFADTFQGSFKDGTEPGNRDYRWFSVFYFAIRAFLLLVWSFSSTVTYFVLGSITLTLMSMAIVALQPYKENTKHNTVMPSFLLYLSCIYLCFSGRDSSITAKQPYVVPFQIIAAAMFFTPIVYISVLVVCRAMQQKLHTRRLH